MTALFMRAMLFLAATMCGVQHLPSLNFSVSTSTRPCGSNFHGDLTRWKSRAMVANANVSGEVVGVRVLPTAKCSMLDGTILFTKPPAVFFTPVSSVWTCSYLPTLVFSVKWQTSRTALGSERRAPPDSVVIKMHTSSHFCFSFSHRSRYQSPCCIDSLLWPCPAPLL